MPASQKLTNYLEDIKARTFARADRFEVTFNIGNLAIPGKFQPKNVGETIQLYCEEVQVPGMILSNKEFNIGAWTFYRNTKIGFLGNEINFTFLTTNDWELRGFFEQWMKACVDTNGQEIGYPEDVMCEIDIKALDVQDNVTKTWRLYEAMPKVLNLVPLSSGTTAPIRNTLIVSAAYWESSDSEKSDGLASFQPNEDAKSNIAGDYDDVSGDRDGTNVGDKLRSRNNGRKNLSDLPDRPYVEYMVPDEKLTSKLELKHDSSNNTIATDHGKEVVSGGVSTLALQHDDNMLASGPMQPSKSRGGLSIESDHGKNVQSDGLHTLEERSERGRGKGLFSFFGL